MLLKVTGASVVMRLHQECGVVCLLACLQPNKYIAAGLLLHYWQFGPYKLFPERIQ